MKRSHHGNIVFEAVARPVRKWMSIVLCIGLVLSSVGGVDAPAAIAAENGTGICPHHEEHDAGCGWQEAKEGSPCTHIHDETCGYTAPAESTPCTHQHDETCGFVEGSVCTHQHDETCGYTAPAEGTPCTHQHDETCGFVEGSVCTHQHDETCGYTAPAEGTPCIHQHDETCGFVEAAEGQPCTFLCEWCVTAWEWNDDEGVLTLGEDTGVWGLGLPGASQADPVTAEFLKELLPWSVTVHTAAGDKIVDLSWDLGPVPEEGIWEGDYTLSAALPEEYVLTDGVPALEVLLALGGGETLDVVNKYLNQWSFVRRDGTVMKTNDEEPNKMTVVVPDLASTSRNELIQLLTGTILPQQIRAWGSTAGNLPSDVITYSPEDKKLTTYEETTADGKVTFTPSANTAWGRIAIKWDFRDAFQEPYTDGMSATIYAYIEPKTSYDGKTYQFYVNSNISADHAPGGQKDTLANPDLLSMELTIRDMNLAGHIVTPADPQNVTVNLFDYWVEARGETPAAPAGDILTKNDRHRSADGARNTDGSDKDIWNQGINAGHLLLFGDGLLHAGLWNKGAGESCDYGKAYAGMEGIVKKVLPASGYPEINTAMATAQMTGDPAYRDYTKIRDWELTGDHENPDYTPDTVQNLSNDVIGTWHKNIDTDTESLDYLFEPQNGTYKKSYKNVTGLFRLDSEGYYYYNMRENFAEFDEGGNRFILYDAPATIRTDAAASIGNFLPFNKGSEVFTGLDADGNLTSSVACHHNTMNHHLGMTVEVDFRQPVNGRIGSGTNARPMTFGFSGDDDVWVYIDDVLVLDLGGIHSEIYGTINFETGEVCIGRAFSARGIPDDPGDPANLVTRTTLKQLFADALGADAISDSDWNADTFASNTSHKLKMFYLERGNYDSSIALRFNLQPLLYQNIAKVDQNGSPLPGVEFELYPASSGTTGDIECLYTDDSSTGTAGVFYVTPDDSRGPLVTLTTDENGYAVFHTPEGGYFNFADRGNKYYVLRETKAPAGYRAQPVDIALHYDAKTSMLTVANRWTSGAYACSVSNVTGPQQLYYAASIASNGQLQSGTEAVPQADVTGGLVVAVPLLRQKATGSWMALYGSNLSGFGSVEASGGVTDWRGFVLQAALEQAKGENYVGWHLDWDAGNSRLYGKLNDLPGLASRYLLNDPENGDMQMVYGIIPPAALANLGITGATADERYEALRQYVKANGVDAAIAAIQGGGSAFRLISVDIFERNFRSLIYVPNERRELRVQKIDQDGLPLEGARFDLFDNPDCTGTPASYGTTDKDGMLIFSPTGDRAKPGQANMAWANSTNTRYYLKETAAPAGHRVNKTVIPVVVGIYGIYADAGEAGDGVSVVADVGRLTQSMRQYAMGNDVDVTLQDLTAFMQVQPSGSFTLDGWQDAKLEGTEVLRSMNLHFGRNEFVDYGLHDQDGGQNYRPFFVTDTGFIRTRVEQNYAALTGGQYDTVEPNANKDNLGGADLTNLFSLLNMVVVTDRTDAEIETGELTISKTVTGEGLTEADYMKLFSFTVELTDANGIPLEGTYDYYFYGTDKAGKVSSGETLLLHHDESLTILGLPAGTRFTVTEGAQAGWHVRPGSGFYTGEIRAGHDFSAAFTNSNREIPEPPTGSLTVRKAVTGTAGDKTREFAFTVSLTGTGSFDYGGARYTLPCALNLKLRDGERALIENLPEGTAYEVTESGNAGYDVTKIGDIGTIVGGMTSAAEFTNHMDGVGGGGDDDDDDDDDNGGTPEAPADARVTVKKVWVLDDGGQMASSVTAAIFRNGTLYDTAELNDENGWTHTWSGLDSGDTWTVEEQSVPEGFISSVSRDSGLDFTITNDDIPTAPPEEPVESDLGGSEPPNPPDSHDDTNPPSPSNIPQTGVSWQPVWLLSAAGTLLILKGIMLEVRRKGKHEA